MYVYNFILALPIIYTKDPIKYFAHVFMLKFIVSIRLNSKISFKRLIICSFVEELIDKA